MYYCCCNNTIPKQVAPIDSIWTDCCILCNPFFDQKISLWGWDFYTVLGGINPDDIRVRHRVVGFVDVWVDSDPRMRPYRARVTPTLCINPGQWAIRQKLYVFIFFYKNSSLKFSAVKIVSAVVAYCIYKKWAIYTAGNKQQHCNSSQGVDWRRQPFQYVSRLEQRLHVFPRSNAQRVDLEGSDLDDTIISCIVFFRSWLSAPLSVATKRIRSGHGQSPYWPRMLDRVRIS